MSDLSAGRPERRLGSFAVALRVLWYLLLVGAIVWLYPYATPDFRYWG